MRVTSCRHLPCRLVAGVASGRVELPGWESGTELGRFFCVGRNLYASVPDLFIVLISSSYNHLPFHCEKHEQSTTGMVWKGMMSAIEVAMIQAKSPPIIPFGFAIGQNPRCCQLLHSLSRERVRKVEHDSTVLFRKDSSCYSTKHSHSAGGPRHIGLGQCEATAGGTSQMRMSTRVVCF